MKQFCTSLLLIFLLMSCASDRKKLILEKGISYELAQYRKQQLSDIVYRLHFSIPKEKDQPIPTTLQVEFTVNDLQNDVFLDFNEATAKLKTITINDRKASINHQKEHIIVDKSLLQLGKNTVAITFDAGETSLNRNNEFLYTLLVPDRASTLFPCFDQPDLKAKYHLTLTAPKDWQVLAGGKLTSSKTSQEGFITHVFDETDVMSTYLFSFVAGKFTEQTQNPGAFDMRFLYRENNPEKIAESVNEVYKIHQNAVDFLESYTAVPFPFQKMDFAAIPPFQYGGMEHVGAIQYRQSSLFLDKNATQNRKLGRAKLLPTKLHTCGLAIW